MTGTLRPATLVTQWRRDCRAGIPMRRRGCHLSHFALGIPGFQDVQTQDCFPYATMPQRIDRLQVKPHQDVVIGRPGPSVSSERWRSKRSRSIRTHPAVRNLLCSANHNPRRGGRTRYNSRQQRTLQGQKQQTPLRQDLNHEDLRSGRPRSWPRAISEETSTGNDPSGTTK